jgi:hypothetical protein
MQDAGCLRGSVRDDWRPSERYVGGLAGRLGRGGIPKVGVRPGPDRADSLVGIHRLPTLNTGR